MVVGQVVGVFGLRGELKVQPLTDVPDRFDGLDHLYLGPDHRRYTVETIRPNRGQLLVKLLDIDSATQAEPLRGLDLAIPRDEIDPLPAGHYYLEDLLGLQVVTDTGTPVGPITDVIRTGSNDVYIVGTGSNAVLIPGIKDAVLDLDLSARTMTIAPWVLEPAE
jgi:16S rRNA processing protein RimM